MKHQFHSQDKEMWSKTRGTLFRADMSVNMPDISRKIKSDKQCLLWQFFVYHFSHFLDNCCQLSVCLPQTVQHITHHDGEIFINICHMHVLFGVVLFSVIDDSVVVCERCYRMLLFATVFCGFFKLQFQPSS